MRKVIGGKSCSCNFCGGNTLYIKINNEVYSQCTSCGNLTKGRVAELRIYEGEYYAKPKTSK